MMKKTKEGRVIVPPFSCHVRCLLLHHYLQTLCLFASADVRDDGLPLVGGEAYAPFRTGSPFSQFLAFQVVQYCLLALL